MARNRKRAKDRTAAPVGARRVDPPLTDPEGRAGGAPDPIAHAAPDAELAAAQIAVGAADGEDPYSAPEPDERLGMPGEEPEPVEVADGSGGGGSLARRGARGAGDSGGEPVAVGAAGPAARTSLWERLITFLQGSWAELQRVQWPDRRQVMQATGVVIGFVIVAGVFLGLADLASQHLMDWILK